MPITNKDRQKIERVQEAYEEWRRTRAPGAMTPRPWPELTIAEAEIAAGMFGMGARAAARLADEDGEEGLATWITRWSWLRD